MESIVAVSKRIDPYSRIISAKLTKSDTLTFPVRIEGAMANIHVDIEYDEENGKKEAYNIFVHNTNERSQGSWVRDWDNDRVSMAVRDVINDLFDEVKASYRKEVISRISKDIVKYCRDKKIRGVR